MAFPFTDDHDMIREVVQGFLQDWYDGGKGPESVYQSGVGYDPQAWNSFAGELGMAGIAIDEAYGGAGLGDLGRVVVMEELGASLCAVPFSPTGTIAVDMIATFADDNHKETLLPRIASGDIIVAYTDGHDALRVERGKLSGRVNNVIFAAQADLLLMSHRVKDGFQLIGIQRKAVGLKTEIRQTMDPTRCLADVILDAVSIEDVIILGTGTPERFDEVVKTSFIGLAAECIGGAQKCLDMTVEYASQRVQFDRPIASFQAVKHRCADMFVLIEGARSAVYAAAVSPAEEKVEAALIAKAYATDAFFEVAGHAIQMHGGIGFTWEYPLQFFFKRARANRSIFGSASRDYVRLAETVFGDAA